MKENDEILADQAAFMDAYMRADEFFRTFEGVVGVGYGQKHTGGAYKDDLAIIVYVREKKPEEALSPGQLIPKEFGGYRTDVVVVREKETVACANPKQYETIRGGIQIVTKLETPTVPAGTLACVVRKRNDSARDNMYLLSAMHVLFDVGVGLNDVIYHPWQGKAGLGPVTAGYYENFPASVPVATGTLHAEFFVDCGVARIDLDSTCCGSTCTQDTTTTKASVIDSSANPEVDIDIVDVRNIFGDLNAVGTPVFKVGRTTRRTAGIIRHIGHTTPAAFVPPNGQPVPAQARNVIHIDLDPSVGATNCDGNNAFVEPGDSGSLVLDMQNRAIGLISFRDVPNPQTRHSTAYACCILPVLDRLQMCIPTMTGTSRGSTKATDGSGLAPAPGEPDFAAGKIVFTAETAEPVTDTEQQHMRALLERLRRTRKGRELHELFALYRREVGYLIRNHKLVKAAWHRHKGPAFLAHVLNHLKGHADRVPREADGVAALTLITHMADLLMRYGSNPLRDAIRAHYDQGLHVLSSHDFDSAGDCIAWLERVEAAA